MILPILLFFSQTIFAGSMYEGDSCTLKTGESGTCTSLNKCPSIVRELMTGILPENHCGYTRFQPIVCCPLVPATTPMVSPLGGIAKQKCAEYSQSLWTLEYPPTLTNENSKPVNTSLCGIGSQSLIIRGLRALRKEFPYMAAIGYDLEKTGNISWHCGGALISETFILTAARCTSSRNSGDAMWVRVGDLDLKGTDDEAASEERRVVERIKHPQFDPRYRYHDLALLRLETRVPFNGWIRPACLHTEPSTEYQRAIVTGWGSVDSFREENYSGHLLRVILPLVERQICNENHTLHTPGFNASMPQGIVEEWMICAGEFRANDDCLDHFGGPLTVYNSELFCMYDVIGVTSLPKSCGSQTPGIFTRVYNYLPWIQSVVWGEG